MGLDRRTTAALGIDMMEKLESLEFCIVGCGGTGANFAEILVRTGARHLTLIDGGNVKESDLNRVFSFTVQDVEEPKVQVLANRLREVGRPGLELNTLYDSFRRSDQILEGHTLGQKVRDAVHDADVVFAATDTNTSRIGIENLCSSKLHGMLLCCGVYLDGKAGVYKYECAWSPKTPQAREEVQGYGPDNASFASIVLEATSVAFTMLLSHLKCGNSQFKRYRRQYDATFTPVEMPA